MGAAQDSHTPQPDSPAPAQPSFTPGPHFAVTGQGAHHRDWYIRDSRGVAIARCCSAGVGAAKTVEANARLFAAASRLYEYAMAADAHDRVLREEDGAFDRFEDTIRAAGWQGDNECPPVVFLDRLRALALALAEGGDQ